MSNPQEIQQQIEQTRASLSDGVNRLGEKVSPGRVVGRRVDRVKGSVSSLRDRVMGSDDGTGVRGAASSVGDTASSLGDSASTAASSVQQAATEAPQAVRRQAQGNPVAAGLIAFGVGWLLSSLAPATDAEARLAQQAEEKAKDQLAEPAKQKAQELAQNLKEPAQQAVEEVKATAADAASDTAEQARSAADDVRQPLQQ
jgi:tryptophanyl-tRNA synthetase